MAWYKQGDLFLSISQSHDSAGHGVFQYDASGTLIGSHGSTAEDLGGLYPAPNGDIWALDWNGFVRAIKPDGSPRWATAMSLPESVVFDRSGYGWVNTQGAVLNQIRYDGTIVATFAPAIESRGMNTGCLHEDGHTLLYTSESDTVFSWDLRTHLQGGNFATLPAPANTSYGICRVPQDGSYLVAVEDGLTGRVDRLSVNGTFMRSYPLPAFFWTPYGVDVEENSQFFWVGCQTDAGGALPPGITVAHRISLASGVVTATLNTGVPTSAVDGCSVNIMKALRSPMLRVF